MATAPSIPGSYTYSIAPSATDAAGTDINSQIYYVISNEGLPLTSPPNPPTPVFYETETGSYYDQNSNGTSLESSDVYQVPNPKDEANTLPLDRPRPARGFHERGRWRDDQHGAERYRERHHRGLRSPYRSRVHQWSVGSAVGRAGGADSGSSPLER